MNKDKTRAVRRKLRVRKKLNNIKKHKLLVFRSSKHIYASVLSESNDKTLCSFSSIKLVLISLRISIALTFNLLENVRKSLKGKSGNII